MRVVSENTKNRQEILIAFRRCRVKSTFYGFIFSSGERCVFGFTVSNVTASLAKDYSALYITLLSATVSIAQKLLGYHQCCYHDF